MPGASRPTWSSMPRSLAGLVVMQASASSSPRPPVRIAVRIDLWMSEGLSRSVVVTWTSISASMSRRRFDGACSHSESSRRETRSADSKDDSSGRDGNFMGMMSGTSMLLTTFMFRYSSPVPRIQISRSNSSASFMLRGMFESVPASMSTGVAPLTVDSIATRASRRGGGCMFPGLDSHRDSQSRCHRLSSMVCRINAIDPINELG